MDEHEFDESMHASVVVVDDAMTDEVEWKCDESVDGGRRNGPSARVERKTKGSFEFRYIATYRTVFCC